MTDKSRFEKFKEKFLHPPEVPKKTLGTVLSEEIEQAVKKRVDEVLPHFADAGSCLIRTNAASFWDQPTKLITITCLVEFHPDMIWKDQDGEDPVANWENWKSNYHFSTDKKKEEDERAADH